MNEIAYIEHGGVYDVILGKAPVIEGGIYLGKLIRKDVKYKHVIVLPFGRWNLETAIRFNECEIDDNVLKIPYFSQSELKPNEGAYVRSMREKIKSKRLNDVA